MGQGFNFDSDDSGADDAWKPPGKSKRKKNVEQGDSSDQIIKCEDEEDLSDDDPDAIFSKTKKRKSLGFVLQFWTAKYSTSMSLKPLKLACFSLLFCFPFQLNLQYQQHMV